MAFFRDHLLSKRIIEEDKSSWGAEKHRLNIKPGSEDQVVCFKDNSRLFLFYYEIPFNNKKKYKHYFITDKKMTLELVCTTGSSRNRTHKVCISSFVNNDVFEEDSYTMNNAVRQRMIQILGPGNFNFSLAFRNSEHLARYVCTGAWISHQMIENGTLRRMFDKSRSMSQKKKKVINTPPNEFLTDVKEGSLDVLYPEENDHVEYKKHTLVISNEDNESQNIVFLGPTGCGKSNLVNQLYNKKVVISKQGACSVTKQIHYTQGQYKGKKVNIVDTIGMCDSTLNKEEVYGLIKDSIIANMICIDKVVIVCAGRIERNHKNAVKQFTKWLQYENHKQNFVFIYNKCEEDDLAAREINMLQMCEDFGADMSVQEEHPLYTKHKKPILALGLKPGLELDEVKSDLTKFREFVLSEPTSKIKVPLDSPQLCIVL